MRQRRPPPPSPKGRGRLIAKRGALATPVSEARKRTYVISDDEIKEERQKQKPKPKPPARKRRSVVVGSDEEEEKDDEGSVADFQPEAATPDASTSEASGDGSFSDSADDDERSFGARRKGSKGRAKKKPGAVGGPERSNAYTPRRSAMRKDTVRHSLHTHTQTLHSWGALSIAWPLR